MAIFMFVLALAGGPPLRAAAAAPTAAAASAAAAAENCAPIDRAAVAGFFDQWNLSLATLDADAVTARYWPDAVLLANAASLPHTSPASIHDYFTHFLAQRPRGRIVSRSIQVGCNLAIDAGTYAFSVMDESGTVSEFPALYTLVYQYRNGTWKILHQHSTLLPEGAAPPPTAAATTGAIAPAPAPAPAPARAPAPAPVAPAHAKRVRVAATAPAPDPAAAAAAAAAAAPAADSAGGFSLRTAPDAAANVAVPGSGSVPAAGAAAKADPTATATAASARSKAKGRHLAKVELTRETRPENGSVARSSWSAMFLNQAGTPDVADFYPAEARSNGERGVVSLRVCSDPHGKLAGAPEVLKGSGHAKLDAAAQEWAHAARWVPATENGSAVEGCTRVSVQFGS